jgi:hypothetical protein
MEHKEERMNEKKVIEIQVNGEDLTVSPTVAHLSPNQEVVWTAGKGIRTFLLVFEQGRPFDRVELRARCDKKNEVCLLRTRVTKKDAGVFHYQVIALVDGDQLVVDTGCPTVIVQ